MSSQHRPRWPGLLVPALLFAVALLLLVVASSDAQASPDATITVDSTGDSTARDGALTLREAMMLATGTLAVGELDAGEADNVSGTPGAASGDTIVFNTTVFSPATPATITLGSTLPALSTGNDTLDGAAAGVIVDGDDQSFHCFEVTSNGNTIRGLEIYNCDRGIYLHSGASGNTIGGSTGGERNVISGNNSSGISIENGGTDGNTVIGNYIGTDASGTAPVGNGVTGVNIGDGAQYNVIGGDSEEERNVISANVWGGIGIGGASDNTIVGNYLGTDASGMIALGNVERGMGINGSGMDLEAARNVIRDNLISGNGTNGIDLYGAATTDNTVIGNLIGTDATGMAALGNASQGIWVGGRAHHNTIGGTTAEARNTISANFIGIAIEEFDGPPDNIVVNGNYIGTDVTGAGDLGNSLQGVRIVDSPDNRIGAATAGAGNVISGNDGIGVFIAGTGASGNQVQGNHIGTDVTGTAYLGNSSGGLSIWSAPSNTIGGTAAGEGNVIAFNYGDGVRVYGTSTTGETIRRNSIHSNGGKGIENTDGGNGELAPPIIDSVAGSVSGHTNPKCYPCTVEVFSDNEDEGRIYHGSAATNDDATGTWSYPGAVTGPNITATITDASGNTSEFSLPFAYEPGDVDCDDDVDAVDALFILQYVVGMRNGSDQCPPPPGSIYLPGADADCDGDVDAVDALFVLQHVVGLRPVLCPGPLKVGTLFDYTGSLAEFGPPIRNGTDLAASHVNSAGGVLAHDMELLHRDSGTDPNIGIIEAQALVDMDGVPAIVGALASDVTLAVAEAVTIPEGAVLISPASTSPAISALDDNDYVFRTVMSDASQGLVLAHLAQEQGFNKAATIYINNAYGQGISQEFTAAFESLGGEVTAAVPYEQGQVTCEDELLEAIAGNPDVLVAILWPQEAIVCLSEAIDGGYIDTFLLPDGAKSQDVIDQVGAEALEGTYGTAPTAMETEGSAIFNASYEAEYGEPPPWPFVNTAYDAVVLLALAAEKAGSTNSSAIRDALRDVANPPGEIVGPGEAGIEQALELVRLGQEVNYEGASGPVDLDENGDVTCGAVEVWRIEEGVFVTVRVDIVGTCGP